MESELISIKVPQSLKRRLRKAAQDDHRNLSDFVRLHLERKLNEDEASTSPKKGGRK